MQKDPYSFSAIVEGQYQVKINIAAWMTRKGIEDFQEKYLALCREDAAFARVCSFNKPILEYISESVFPLTDKIDQSKKKVMIVFGNPATNSIVKKMFFYSRQDGGRHPIWKKLEDAGLLLREIRDNLDDREEEAERIRTAIIKGATSVQYTLGLTTFYSFPTPVKTRKMKYGDVAGVESLFRAVISILQREEIKRLENYDFGKGAIWICTQDTSYKYIEKDYKGSSVKYWPMRNSGGNYLSEILRKV